MRDVNELLKTERQRSAERSSEDGDERVRTADPLRAKQVLSQLSYAPVVLHLALDGGPGPT